jgi:hypothetical protein
MIRLENLTAREAKREREREEKCIGGKKERNKII